MNNNARRNARCFSALQIVTILMQLAAGCAALSIYHHLSRDYFVPWQEFFLSLKLAWPPIIIAALSYVILMVTGKHFSEAGKAFIHYLRNSFFQSRRQMLLACVVGFVLCGAAVVVIRHVTPPSYDKVVRGLLGGESDDYQLVTQSSEKIRALNPGYGDMLRVVTDVFRARAKTNFAGMPAKARMFIRSLSAMDEWQGHPLHMHALAEAYSIAAQTAAAPSAFGAVESGVVSNFFAQSVELYTQVAESRSPLTTELLRFSAILNIGNQYYYQGQYERAVTQWRKANQSPNTSAWGNIVAGLVKTKDFQSAIDEAEGAKEWAEDSGKALLEPSSYSSIPANATMACWHVGRTMLALDFARDALAVMDDELNQVNFAYALLLAQGENDAIRYLRTVSTPISMANQSSWVREGARGYGHQLIWAIADTNAPSGLKVARLSAFLREAYTDEELALSTPEDVRAAVERVLSKKDDAGLCADLLAIPETVERITALYQSDLSGPVLFDSRETDGSE